MSLTHHSRALVRPVLSVTPSVPPSSLTPAPMPAPHPSHPTVRACYGRILAARLALPYGRTLRAVCVIALCVSVLCIPAHTYARGLVSGHASSVYSAHTLSHSLVLLPHYKANTSRALGYRGHGATHAGNAILASWIAPRFKL